MTLLVMFWARMVVDKPSSPCLIYMDQLELIGGVLSESIKFVGSLCLCLSV